MQETAPKGCVASAEGKAAARLATKRTVAAWREQEKRETIVRLREAGDPRFQ